MSNARGNIGKWTHPAHRRTLSASYTLSAVLSNPHSQHDELRVHDVDAVSGSNRKWFRRSASCVVPPWPRDESGDDPVYITGVWGNMIEQAASYCSAARYLVPSIIPPDACECVTTRWTYKQGKGYAVPAVVLRLQGKVACVFICLFCLTDDD